MAKHSFSDELPVETGEVIETPTQVLPAAPTAQGDKEEVSKALAPVTPQSPVAQGPTAPAYTDTDDAEGEFSNRDIQWPGLSIVTKTSDEALITEFGIGSWLIGKEEKIGTMDNPVSLVAVKIQKAYQEQLPFGSQTRPKMFRKLEEAAEAGFSLDWEAENRVAEVLGVRFWVPQPEGMDAPHIFILEGPEGPGTIVKFFAARTAYGTVGKTLIKAKQTYMRADKGGMVSGWWKLTATKETKNQNSWLLPRIVPGGKTSPELAQYLRDLAV